MPETTSPTNIQMIIAQCADARAAEPGEMCDCGRPAVVVFEPLINASTPWCGISDGEVSE